MIVVLHNLKVESIKKEDPRLEAGALWGNSVSTYA